MSTYSNTLENHQELASRRDQARQRLSLVREKFAEYQNFFEEKKITVYSAGSIGRGDYGNNSDLDLFLISDNKKAKFANLDSLRAVAHAITINEFLGYPNFSNDGKYLKVCELRRMLETLGSPQDDNENWFTVRMLLLLESQWICNERLYEAVTEKITAHYFRDSRGKQSFRPLFLLNDILRYWRTLCLNYELARDDQEKPWYKKNINLKFSRMITIFGTVLAIITKPQFIIGLYVDWSLCLTRENLKTIIRNSWMTTNIS